LSISGKKITGWYQDSSGNTHGFPKGLLSSAERWDIKEPSRREAGVCHSVRPVLGLARLMRLTNVVIYAFAVSSRMAQR
jgi:hypothetical protein